MKDTSSFNSNTIYDVAERILSLKEGWTYPDQSKEETLDTLLMYIDEMRRQS